LDPGLEEILQDTGNILFIGIGNVLKSDDGVGVEISNRILNCGKIRSLTVEVSIENYIGKIKSLAPERVVLIDCMDLGSGPGSYRLMSLENVEDRTFNTHNISLGRIGEFIPFPAYILGIQPQTLVFGDTLSVPVQHAAEEIIRLINQTTE
jgi:hydrogenase maturation protease